MANEPLRLPRYFACARDIAAYGTPTGWYVCDEKLRDKHDRPRSVHDEPTYEAEARELARMLNDGVIDNLDAT